MNEKDRIERKAARAEQGFLKGSTVYTSDGATPLEPHPVVVPLKDRQGVFAHSLKCTRCQLEFVVFSWRDDDYRRAHTACPECEHNEFSYYVTVVSESREFHARERDGAIEVRGDEIAALWPFRHDSAETVRLGVVEMRRE